MQYNDTVIYLLQLLSRFDSDVDSVVTGNYRTGIHKDVRFITMAINKFEEFKEDIEDLLPSKIVILHLQK